MRVPAVVFRVLAGARASGVLAILIASVVAGGIPIVPQSAPTRAVFPVKVHPATIAALSIGFTVDTLLLGEADRGGIVSDGNHRLKNASSGEERA